MPLEHKLRDALHQEAAGVRPDVDRLSRQLAERTGRRRRARPAGFAVGVALLTLSVAAVAVVLAPRPSPVDPADRLAGTYRVTLDAGAPGARDWSLAGAWTMTLGTDSSVTVVPPAGFSAAWGDDPDGVHALRGDRMFIDLFSRTFDSRCAGFGTYEWETTPEALEFTLVEDACEPRSSLLAAGTWIRE